MGITKMKADGDGAKSAAAKACADAGEVLKKTVKEATEEALKIKSDLDQETADVLGDMAKTQTAELEATKLQVEQTKREAAKIIADVRVAKLPLWPSSQKR